VRFPLGKPVFELASRVVERLVERSLSRAQAGREILGVDLVDLIAKATRTSR
jgi:hypothetical protein